MMSRTNQFMNDENAHPKVQQCPREMRSKLGYFQQKATFYLDEDTKGFSQTFQENTNQYKYQLDKNSLIHFWPNYPITHSKLNLNNSLPKMKDDSKIRPLKVSLEEEQIKSIEKRASAVGQVFVVYVEKNNFIEFLEISCATFSIVEFNNGNLNKEAAQDIYGLTVAHAFMDSPLKAKDDYYRLIFVSLSEIDTFEDFKKSLQIFKAKKRRQIMSQSKDNGFNIKDFNKLLQDYLQNEDKFFKELPIFQAYINFEFLEYRRELIFTFSESQGSHQFLLDPINGLQCLPSIDCCLLSFDDKLINYINAKQIDPIQINSNYNNQSSNALGNIVSMIGYQQIEGTIFQKRDPTYLINIFNKNASISPIEVNKIINPHKTLQIGQFAKTNNYILTFEASTTQGSSGSPIFNLNGELIGINTGYFDDITEYEDTEATTSFSTIINFDKNVKENQSNYHKFKNYNCGIDINHIIFQAFASRNMSIFQQIHSMNPNELKKSIPPNYRYSLSVSNKKSKQNAFTNLS